MQFRNLALMSFLVGTMVLNGCGNDSAADLNAPDQLVLYSLDGDNDRPGPKSKETFHDVPVLGKMKIKSARENKKIMSALKEGIARSDGSRSKCFIPRHGLRVVESNGKTVDYVICFECLQVEVHQNGKSNTGPITTYPQSLLNSYLNEAGIPLAPTEKNHDD